MQAQKNKEEESLVNKEEEDVDAEDDGPMEINALKIRELLLPI